MVSGFGIEFKGDIVIGYENGLVENGLIIAWCVIFDDK